MTQRVFITKKGKASFSCSECGKSKLLDVSKYNTIDKQVKLKYTCECKHAFSVILERRHQPRKEVALNGCLTFNNKKYSIKVVDITRQGLRFTTHTFLELNVEDKAAVEFTLDDASRSRISKEVIIRKVDKNGVGVEFSFHDHYDKLGPYLLFHAK